MAAKSRFDILLVVDDQYTDLLLGLLDHAKTSIDILAYSFAIGSASGSFSEKGAPYRVAKKILELKKKLGKKLKVRLYIEGERETSARNRVTATYLKKAGVEVKYGATHAKGFCIDGRYVLFGSTNLTNQSMVKNNETNLLIDRAGVAQEFLRYFEHLWEGGRHGGIKLKAPMIADGGFKNALIELIDGAKSRLEFSIYFFHHTELQEALLRAHRRGVKVRGFIHDHASFALSYVRRTRGTAARLREGGVKDLSFGPKHLFTHSKYLIADRKELLLGTGNWLHEDIKVHPQLYIRLKDSALAKQLAKHLETQIKAAKGS